jgi:hypothetical protein
MMKAKSRWYDAHKKLAEALEQLKELPRNHRDRIVNHVIALINDNAPILLEKYLLDFPLERERRRWYDKDPYLWLMVNGLQYASPDLLRKTTKYMVQTVVHLGNPDRAARGGVHAETQKRGDRKR